MFRILKNTKIILIIQFSKTYCQLFNIFQIISTKLLKLLDKLIKESLVTLNGNSIKFKIIHLKVKTKTTNMKLIFSKGLFLKMVHRQVNYLNLLKKIPTIFSFLVEIVMFKSIKKKMER